MAVLDTAEALYQANNYAGSGQWLDESGNGHHANFGTGTPGTNDPTFFTNAQYVYLPGVNGNYLSTADTAALSIADNLDLQVRVALDDWTPATNNCLIGKYNASGNQRSFLFQASTAGNLQAVVSDNGSATEVLTSTVGHGISDGGEQWVRWTFETGTSKFYLGGTGATPSWTQLGSNVVGAKTSIFDSTESVRLGAYGPGGTNQICKGKFWQWIIRSAVGGSIELDADATDTAAITEPFASFTENSSNAATVTINRSGTGAVTLVIDRPQFFLVTNDYFEVADAAGLDFAAADSFSVMLWIRRPAGSPAAAQALVAKRAGLAGSNTGWSIISNTDGTAIGEIADGTNESSDATGSALTTRVNATVGFVRNVTDDDIDAFKNGAGSGSPTTDATTATLANSEVMRFGRLSGAATSYARMQLFAVAVWRSALTDAQMVEAHNEMVGTLNPVVMSPAAVSTFGAAVTAVTPSPPGAGLGGSFRSKLWRPGMMLRTRNQ